MDAPTVKNLLLEKKALLERFEAATRQMLAAPREQLPALVEERQRLAEAVDRVDGRLAAACGQPGAQEALEWLLKGTGASPAPEWEPARQAAREVRAILSRLREDDLQAALRLRVEQERILEQIKASNQGGAAKAARFSSFAGGKGGRPPFGSA